MKGEKRRREAGGGRRPPATGKAPSPKHAHERESEDIDVRGVLRFAVIVVIATLVAVLAMRLLFDQLLAREQAQDPPRSPFAERDRPRLPPPPRLQVAPEEELRRMRGEEDERLLTYGWIDREAGRVRIPIERAMDLIAAEDGEEPGPEPAGEAAGGGGSRSDSDGDKRMIADAAPPAASVPAAQVLPEALRAVAFEQRLGAPLPLALAFRDESGGEVLLGDHFGERPVILALVYYECPMLCTLVLNGLTSALKAIPFDAGREFEVVAVSFNPRETPALAAAKKEAYLARYGRPGTAAGWHFLTGEEPAIRCLTDSVGFRFAYDPAADRYAHAAGILVLTPAGNIARVFYGVEYAPRDLRLGLVEASRGEIGTFKDQLLLYCFHYDPAAGKYGAAVLDLVRAGGMATVLGGGLVIAILLRRERRARRAPPPSGGRTA